MQHLIRRGHPSRRRGKPFPHLPSAILLPVLIPPDGPPGHQGDAEQGPRRADDEARRELAKRDAWEDERRRTGHPGRSRTDGGAGEDAVDEGGLLGCQRRRDRLLLGVESGEGDVGREQGDELGPVGCQLACISREP